MACGPSLSVKKSAAPRLPDTKQRVPPAPPPADWFWEDVPVSVRPATTKPLVLPLAEKDLVHPGRFWDGLSADGKLRLRRDGVVVLGDPAEAFSSVGALYNFLREQHVPSVITIDALVTITMLAVERALAEVEETVLAPELAGLLGRLETRLGKENAGASTELVEGYRVARGVVAVARSLAGSTIAPDMTSIVAEERARIDGVVRTPSPLLGVELDPGDFVVPSEAARPGLWRALAWLAAAPLGMVGKGEAIGATIDVAQARTNTRAAMLLARVCDHDIDPAINASYTRLARILGFVWGAPDDLTLTELDGIATAAGVDLTKPASITNVTRVDRVRAHARAGRIPALRDGPGAIGRAGIGVRLFGGHATLDAIALQSLLAPAVGPTTRKDQDMLARDGHRVLPASLDLAAWLGLPEAHALLHETHADAFDGFTDALDRAEKLRPDPATSTLHASVQGSLLDALVTWAGAREGAGFGDTAGWGVPNTATNGRRRTESLLSAWTMIHHAGSPLARAKPTAAAPTGELGGLADVKTAAFVEPLPEVIAQLAGAVGQLQRGLNALIRWAPGSVGLATLIEVEDILRVALRTAERHVSDEALSSEEEAALAALPARLVRLEGKDPLGPGVAEMASDPAGNRILILATGTFEPALLVARDANKDEAVVAIGAQLAHHEVVAAPPALSDAAWRTTLRSTTARPAWTDAFRIRP